MWTKCCDESDIDRVVSYIGDKYYESLYLYLDIKKYGIKSPNVKCWILEDNEHIQAVSLKYHTGMHIFSNEKKFRREDIVKLIKDENPTIICGEKSIIQQIGEGLPMYSCETGHVAKYTSCECESTEGIKRATKEDYNDMAKMLISDADIGASYSLEEMVNQISERIADGYSRSYCLYVDGKLVAQASTGAEESNVATIVYVMTDANERKKGYAKRIVSHLSNELKNEGYDVYLVYYEEGAGKLYSSLGYKDVCEIGKLYVSI